MDDTLNRVATYQENAGIQDPYERLIPLLAARFGVDKSDPRLKQAAVKEAKRIIDQGYDVNEFLDAFKAGGPKPAKRPIEGNDEFEKHQRSIDAAMGERAPAPQRKVAGLTPIEQQPDADIKLEEPTFLENASVRRSKMTDPKFLAADARQVVRGVDDALFNIATRATPLGAALAPSEAEDTRVQPGTRPIANIATTVLGPGRLAAAPFNALARPAVNLAARGGRVVGTVAGALTGAASVPIVAGELGGAKALADTLFGEEQLANIPKRTLQAAKDASTPINLALGTAAGAAGGYSAGVRNSGQTGEDIRLVEQYGGKPSLTRGAKGGAFDSDLLRSRRGTSAEVQELARDANDEIRGGLNARRAQSQADYGAREAEYLRSPEAKQGVDITDHLTGALDDISNDMRIPQAERAAYAQRIMAEFQDDPLLQPLLQRQSGRIVALPKELNAVRQRFDRLARTAEGSEDPIMRGVAERLRDAEDTTGYAGVKAPFATETENLRRGHELLGMGKVASTADDAIAASKRGARVLRRGGENTATGGLENKDVAEFLERFPEFENQVMAPRLLAAKNRMTPSLQGEGGTLYSRVKGIPERNIEPIEATILYPAGKALGKAAPYVGSTGNKVFDAYAEWKRRQEEAAQSLPR